MFSSMYILHHLICQNLPLLPKPLSILKTAETRTYLSKLIWLGNGGRRPQYGNPDTKPLWWPQHILPWEEMKKMGGRKSVELSNINYTEILKQCLATVRRTNVGIKNIFIYINIFYRDTNTSATTPPRTSIPTTTRTRLCSRSAPT